MTKDFLIIKERQRELSYTNTYSPERNAELSNAIDDGSGCFYWEDIKYIDDVWGAWGP